ncbi:MAG TPA: DUF4824 family protein [Bryobacteraceae bacterium]|nr:DUF4824 family protein [Bryobacteraceae bacterium]
MKRSSLLAAAAVVVVANVFALVHASRNRSGAVDSDITLTEREVSESYGATDEDSGVTVNLNPLQPLYGQDSDPPWLDRKILEELGFDTSAASVESGRLELYPRQRPRRAFVALEYDGPGWRKWIDARERRFPQAQLKQRETSTRLIAVDAGRDAAQLRARHPDRNSVIVVPGVIRMAVEPRRGNEPARPYGLIQEIPTSLHVPRPFSDIFRRLKNRGTAQYRVHLRYGAALEPWIAGVEFVTPVAP